MRMWEHGLVSHRHSGIVIRHCFLLPASPSLLLGMSAGHDFDAFDAIMADDVLAACQMSDRL